jgi:hypothetical protein
MPIRANGLFRIVLTRSVHPGASINSRQIAKGGKPVDGDELIYARGELSVESLQREIARFWADAAVSPELQAELDNAGLNYEASGGAEFSQQIKVRAGSSGADPASVILIISLAPSVNRVLKDVWADIILPRIKRRWGDDAIGGEQPGRKK